MNDVKKIGVQLLAVLGPLLIQAFAGKAQSKLDRIVQKHG